MSYIFDLFYNSFPVEEKIDECVNIMEITKLENQLKNILKENSMLLDNYKFLIKDKLEILINKEREFALMHGIKIGFDIKDFFSTLL